MVRKQTKGLQLPRAIAIDSQRYVSHGKGIDRIIRREVVHVINGMVGRRNDGGFDSMKFRNGKSTTRRRLFHKVRQQVIIRRSEQCRRIKKRDQRDRKKRHTDDQARFMAKIAAMANITAGGAVTNIDGGVTAIRGMGDDIFPSHLNEMWLSWDAKTDVKTFYGRETRGDNVGKQSPLSNFHQMKKPFKFTVPDEINGFNKASILCNSEERTVWCSCSEKAIMLCKAAAMGDEESFEAIKASTQPGEAKRLGRRVRKFDYLLWDKIVCSVAYSVILQKFSQDEALTRILMNTSETLIAEASPMDDYWGIGLQKGDLRTADPTEWRGCNILGWALMAVRETLWKAEDAQYGASSAGVLPPGHEKGIWIMRPTETEEDAKSIESILPQIGDKVTKRKVEMMNAKFFLRRATRKHGKDYEGAANMLMKMHTLEGLPDEVRKEIKTELAEVSAIILMEGPSKDYKSFEEDRAGPEVSTNLLDLDDDDEPFPNTAFQDNMIGFVSTDTREMAANAIEKSAGIEARSRYVGLMTAQLQNSKKKTRPPGRRYDPQVATIAAEAVKRICPVTSSVFPELFELSYEWIYDSGASRHFLRTEQCQKNPQHDKEG